MPRPRFTLRVMLVVTTIAAVVAWQYSIVLRRREAMDENRHWFFTSVPIPGAPAPQGLATVNPLRELLGDKAIQHIYVRPGDDEDKEVARLRPLFPEAGVEVKPTPYEW